MPSTDNGNVTFIKSSNGIATISFYHPAQNSLPTGLLNDLAGYITQTGNDPDVKVIVLKSGGDRTFCAGASFDELVQIKDKEAGALFFRALPK